MVVIKKPHSDTCDDVLGVFLKEAKLLSEISHPNIVKLLAVNDEPISIMMEYCEFSFQPFDRNESVSSLNKLLTYLVEEDLLQYFPGIGNYIVRDIAAAICYLHNNDIVHRDIKPSNILVSNQAYSHLPEAKMQKVFRVKPITCKVGDLGEARSTLTRTNGLCVNSRTNGINRGSQAFMAPEISIIGGLINASIDDLKAVDVWAVLMTFFVVLNPDQKYPFEILLKNNPHQNIEHAFKSHLARRRPPPASDHLKVTQALYYQNLRYTFYENLKFNPSHRCRIDDLAQQLNVNDKINSYYPLKCSQATALESSDIVLIEEDIISNTFHPDNDGTNACAFLTLRIIDTLIEMSEVDADYLVDHISAVIAKFPESINTLRDVTAMADIYEAYALLSDNKLLDHNLLFNERIVDNQTLFSYELQLGLSKELETLRKEAVLCQRYAFCIFHGHAYIFSIGANKNGEIFVIETHPMSAECGGNGNGLLIKSKSITNILEWIIKRMITSGVKEDCTPFLIKVTSEW